MDGTTVERWFAEYLEFAVVARSEHDVVELLQWYSVPLTITLDDAAIQMATAEEVVAVVGAKSNSCRRRVSSARWNSSARPPC